MHIFLAVLLDENHQLIEVALVGQPLHHVRIKHVRQAGVLDGEDLLLMVSFIVTHHSAKVCAVCD